eukprot:gene816-1592_t
MLKCNRHFVNNHALEQHSATSHPEDIRHTCGKTFRTLAGMVKHNRVFHNDLIESRLAAPHGLEDQGEWGIKALDIIGVVAVHFGSLLMRSKMVLDNIARDAARGYFLSTRGETSNDLAPHHRDKCKACISGNLCVAGSMPPVPNYNSGSLGNSYRVSTQSAVPPVPRYNSSTQACCCIELVICCVGLATRTSESYQKLCRTNSAIPCAKE